MSNFYPSDQLGFAEKLSVAEQTALLRLRAVLETQVYPCVNEYWDRGELPEQLIGLFAELEMMQPAEILAAGEKVRGLFEGFRNFELARCDASVATLYNAQSGLFRTLVNRGGTPEQAAALDPEITSYRLKGVFALTEPEHGSDIAGGLSTSAKFVADGEGGSWTINGVKRWIGGAEQADVLAVFARDTADEQVKCFLVPAAAHGVQIAPIEGKASLRIIQNSQIELDDVCVPDSARLTRINSFKDVSDCLRSMRSDVAWIATGAAAGAYEAALKYVLARKQFGKPLASFQLVQEKLARMLANITASLGVVVQLSEQQEQGVYKDESSAMAKMFTATMLRETVALAREVCGGNGILLDHDVARFHADAEAIYSYEGTHEINALILGRAVTGISAFH